MSCDDWQHFANEIHMWGEIKKMAPERDKGVQFSNGFSHNVLPFI
jgi:hypothetical protein